jgi:hypothetical protein
MSRDHAGADKQIQEPSPSKSPAFTQDAFCATSAIPLARLKLPSRRLGITASVVGRSRIGLVSTYPTTRSSSPSLSSPKLRWYFQNIYLFQMPADFVEKTTAGR